MTIISIIAAMDLKRTIGFNKSLPWPKPIPADWENLFKVTKGKKMIMGRKSYEDKHRVWSELGNIVISTNENLMLENGFVHANTLKEALNIYNSEKEVFVLGGQRLFTEALPLATNLYLTIVHDIFEGDTFFPEFKTEDYEILSKKSIGIGPQSPYPIEIIHYFKTNKV